MDIKKVQQLLKVVEENNIAEIEVEQDGLRILIRKTPVNQIAAAPAAAQIVAPVAVPAAVSAGEAASVEAKEEGTVVKSPIVGTFYGAPSPEDDDFIKVGDVISEGQVVCIIEAMKIMNEIESEVSGKVIKILAENAQPVEFDQPLFLVQE